MKKKVLFPAFLAALALPLCLHTNPIRLNAEFIGEYDVKADYVAYAKEVNGQMADEGFVLLKNDGFLPMNGDEMVSVVGKASIKLARGGAGSGSGSIDGSVGSDSNLNLKASLVAAGFQVNPTTDSFYNSSESGGGRTNGNDGWKGNSEVTIGETPIATVNAKQGLVDSFADYGDAAIMVIAREGSEGCDVKTCNAHDSTKTNSNAKAVSNKHALELSDNEQDLFDLLHEHFDHIIMIINSSNIFECGQFQDDPKVSGVLWIGNPGDVGPMAIGRILSGEVNPSGRTVDTWARDFTADPTFQNFSDNSQTNYYEDENGQGYYFPQDTMLNADGTPMRSYGSDKSYKNTSSPNWDNNRGGAEQKVVAGGINGVKPAAYVSYEEGIYVDYRYYETKYADMAKDDKAAADAWYNGETGVVYPFGFGCSYTTFNQQIIRVAPAKNASLQANDVIEVSVKVTNTGSVAGKDAIQLYWKAPYKAGEIEKADHVLCAFDKTHEIEPGKSEIMHLSFHLQDVANYDCFDANNNDFCGYELDAGDYELLLGKNAHEAYSSISFKVDGQGIQYEKDRFTGYTVENRFTDCGFNDTMPGENDIEFTQMSRANFEETFPTHPTFEDRMVKEGSRYEEFLTHTVTIEEFENGNYEYVPEQAHKTKQDFIDNGWEQKSVKDSDRTQLSAMQGIPYDDPRWEEFINEFTYSEMLQYVEKNGMSTSRQDNIGKGGFSEGDGPQKFSIIWWVSSPIVAATFNPRLAHQQGECCGMESHINGKSGWWGPAVNTHRSPFGGRNFEYYSADPFLMGRIAAEVVRAATDRGIYAYFKHFAVNDQEKNRESGISFLTEQALREIYLKSFQMVFEEAQSIGVMASYNRFGLMETAASYNLLTEVLRNEWGFKGCVLSDMAHASNSSIDFGCYENVNWRILGGCNLQLTQGSTFSGKCTASWSSSGFDGKGCPVSGGVEAYSFWYACRQLTKGYMYMAAQCTGMNRGLTAVDKEVELTYKINEDIDYEVEVEGATSYKANLRVDTSLPEGLEFDDGYLTGKLAHVGLYRVDVIATIEDGNNVTKKAVKLIINVVPDESEYFDPDAQPVDPSKPDDGGDNKDNNKPKKGCFGDATSVAALSGVIALAGISMIVLSLANKKRKEI